MSQYGMLLIPPIPPRTRMPRTTLADPIRRICSGLQVGGDPITFAAKHKIFSLRKRLTDGKPLPTHFYTCSSCRAISPAWLTEYCGTFAVLQVYAELPDRRNYPVSRSSLVYRCPPRLRYMTRIQDNNCHVRP
jgi:hypothetical protein